MSIKVYEPYAGPSDLPGRVRTLAVGEPVPAGAVVVGSDTPAFDNTVMSGVTFRQMQIVSIPLANVDTGGGVASWQNPETVDIAIVGCQVDVQTKASAACSLDIGTTSTNGTTQADNLIDGLDVGTAAGLYDVADQAGANGKTKQRLAAGKWVTASKDSGASAGLAGFLHITYYRLA